MFFGKVINNPGALSVIVDRLETGKRYKCSGRGRRIFLSTSWI